jgi:hypothetical protein
VGVLGAPAQNMRAGRRKASASCLLSTYSSAPTATRGRRWMGRGAPALAATIQSKGHGCERGWALRLLVLRRIEAIVCEIDRAGTGLAAHLHSAAL